ncbi:MAG TPA: sialidase family protein, partial [Candidatus Dormibacteraeota bacterium]|nr:sialidase family protein [Candidatus Dormibacteraeota bacterium]
MVTLTPRSGWFTEPSVTVNPQNPRQVAVAFQNNARVSFSTDGGETWHAASGTAPTDFRVSGDVSIAYDNQGHAILCYIAFDKLGTTDYWAHNATRNGVFVRRSLDGGKTWAAKAVAVIQHDTAPGIP